MYYVYVLISKKDKKFYSGFTTDLIKRFKEHQEGKVFATKDRKPLKLAYYEACHNKYDALQRERYLKSGRGKRFLRSRLKYYLKNNGLGPNEAAE